MQAFLVVWTRDGRFALSFGAHWIGELFVDALELILYISSHKFGVSIVIPSSAYRASTDESSNHEDSDDVACD